MSLIVSLAQILDSPIGNKPSASINSFLDQIRLIIGLSFAILCGFLFHAVSGTLLRHITSSILGLFIQYLVYGIEGLLNLLAISVTSYILLLVVSRKNAGFYLMSYTMFYLSIVNVYRIIYDYAGWTMDSSIMLMYVVIKISSLAFSYQDGGLIEGSDRYNLMTDFHRAKMITTMPSALQFFSYNFCFANMIIGPANQFVDFRNFIEKKKQYKKIPCTLAPAMKKIGISIVCILITLKIHPLFPSKYCITEEYNQQPYYIKVLWWQAIFYLSRIRYYCGWDLADAAVCSSGLSYSENGKWDLCQNADVLMIQTSTNDREMKEHWNQSCGNWLKNYVYERVRIYYQERKKKGPLSPVVVTASIAALWHGFYLNYYVVFATSAMLTELSRLIYKRKEYFSFIPPRARKALSLLLSVIIVNFWGTILEFLQIGHLWIFLKNVKFIPFFVLIGGIILVPIVLPVKRTSKAQKKIDGKQE